MTVIAELVGIRCEVVPRKCGTDCARLGSVATLTRSMWPQVFIFQQDMVFWRQSVLGLQHRDDALWRYGPTRSELRIEAVHDETKDDAVHEEKEALAYNHLERDSKSTVAKAAVDQVRWSRRCCCLVR